MDLKKSLLRHIESTELIGSGSTVLVAVSGGRDSMALLHVLRSLEKPLQLTIHAGHINHRLRVSSNEDAAFTEKQCKEWGIPFLSTELDPMEKTQSESTEAWAREERYKALQEILESINGDCIATAHHANDQAETVLFRLQQKSGIDGLRGIHEKRGNIIRPFLPFKRRDIDIYIENHSISFIEDKTNRDTKIPRNFIRHKILNPWEEQDGGVIDALVSVSEESKKLAGFMNQALSNFIGRHVHSESSGEFTIHTEALSALPEKLQSRVIKMLAGESENPWRRHQWNDVSEFLRESDTGNILNLPFGYRLLKDRNHWIITNNSAEPVEIVLNPGEPVNWMESRITWDWAKKESGFSSNPNTELVDGRLFSDNPVILRNWKPGDRFNPLGMNHSKKVSDFLTDEKSNRFEKEQQLVIEVGNEIVWVCGKRISETVRVTSESLVTATLVAEKIKA